MIYEPRCVSLIRQLIGSDERTAPAIRSEETRARPSTGARRYVTSTSPRLSVGNPDPPPLAASGARQRKMNFGIAAPEELSQLATGRRTF